MLRAKADMLENQVLEEWRIYYGHVFFAVSFKF